MKIIEVSSLTAGFVRLEVIGIEVHTIASNLQDLFDNCLSEFCLLETDVSFHRKKYHFFYRFCDNYSNQLWSIILQIYQLKFHKIVLCFTPFISRMK